MHSAFIVSGSLFRGMGRGGQALGAALLAASMLFFVGCGQSLQVSPPESRRADKVEEWIVNSPAGTVAARIRVEPSQGTELWGRVVISASLSSLGGVVETRPELLMTNGSRLGVQCKIERVEISTVRESFRQVTGKRSAVLVDAEQAVVTLVEKPSTSGVPDASGLRWTLTVRAANDGVAFRATIDGPPGVQCDISREDSRFILPRESRVWAMPLKSFTTSHEGLYKAVEAQEINSQWIMATPLLAKLPGGAWTSITEADLTDYAGMYLSREADPTHALSQEIGVSLISRLSPRPDQPQCAVRGQAPLQSPWRVILLGDSPGRFLESDFVLSLNAPCALQDVSWIHPGKTTFPWWNAFIDPVASARGIDLGLNTATAKYYIDFCAASGIAFHTLDGKGDLAWYGGPISYAGADPTRAVEGLDLPEVLSYAKDKGVGIHVWLHWKAARDHMARAFPLYRKWGIQGVMLDFMDRDDQEMVQWQRSAIELAAANHLTVKLHGTAKPTGLERTYPNLLSSEGVWNLEQNKWDKKGCTPEHELTTFFTRMVAGPMDFHQGGVRTVAQSAYLPSWGAPVVIGTPCRSLASYVVIQNHLPMVCDYPSAYLASPLLEALSRVPVTWDETHVLAADVGELIVIARRSGDSWWIAAMTRTPQRISVPLWFLSSGAHESTIWSDAPESPGGLSRTARKLSSQDIITLDLADAGAAVVEVHR